MTDKLVIALAQLNPTVGDIVGNANKIRSARAEAACLGADIVVCTELIIAGYPPEDLVLKRAFQEANEAAIRELAAETENGGPALLVGAPWRSNDCLYNAMLLLDEGEVRAVVCKHQLPNYGVFDERRIFAEGPLPGPVVFQGVRFGVMICEDMWSPDVTECLQETGAEILIVGNGSPFELEKSDERIEVAVQRVVDSGLPLIYVNQVGGQDELVFDGASFVLNADRTLAGQAPTWREHLMLTRWYRDDANGWVCESASINPTVERRSSIYQAMMIGLRDYVDKNDFPGVILGLSGGIDSALSAVVAVDALGANRVQCFMMPSKFTSQMSLDDAAKLANEIGISLSSIPINPAVNAFDDMLSDSFVNLEPDTTEENIQARIRAVILMALSNKLGQLLLTTGNKSEMSVGYATLYGDMSGGYSVLKDVYKSTVYELARWRNEELPEGAYGPIRDVIPDRIITRAPSAELRLSQTDQDSLPPYDVLDDILRCLVEGEMSTDQVVNRGHSMDIISRVARMLYQSEYKRRQAPPGVRITHKSFGRDRRYPITNSFLEDK